MGSRPTYAIFTEVYPSIFVVERKASVGTPGLHDQPAEPLSLAETTLLAEPGQPVPT